MPKKPKRPCAYPGCPRLTDGQYCKEHRKAVDHQYNKYTRSPDVHRKYGRAWKRIRDRYASEHPFCEMCRKAGRLVRAAEVHHIKPLAEGGSHAFSNLISLCHRCHARVHAQRGDYMGKNKVYGYEGKAQS